MSLLVIKVSCTYQKVVESEDPRLSLQPWVLGAPALY